MTELQRLERNFWRSSSPSPCLIRFPTVGSAPGILHYGWTWASSAAAVHPGCHTLTQQRRSTWRPCSRLLPLCPTCCRGDASSCSLITTETGGKIQEKYLTFSLLKQVMQPTFTWTFPFHTRRTSVMQQLRTTRSNTSPETGIFHKTSQLVIFELSFAWGWLFSAHYRCLFYSFSGTRTAFSLCSAQDAP